MPFHDIDVGVYVSDIKEKESVYYALDLSEHLSSLIKVPVEVHVLNFAPIDYEIIFDILQKNLDQFRQFSKTITALL